MRPTRAHSNRTQHRQHHAKPHTSATSSSVPGGEGIDSFGLSWMRRQASYNICIMKSYRCGNAGSLWSRIMILCKRAVTSSSLRTGWWSPGPAHHTHAHKKGLTGPLHRLHSGHSLPIRFIRRLIARTLFTQPPIAR